MKLVEFRMPNSQVKKLWDGVQDLLNLKLIDLNGSQQLMELPDFSKARKLEGVYLSNCPSLCHVHPSLLSLHTVVELMLFKCVELKSLQSEIHLRSLKHLDVNGCSSLKEFSLSSEEIRALDLSDTKIERLFLSIGHCSNLEWLYLGNSIKNLPNEFSNLRSLKVLEICHCRELDTWNLHIILDGLRSLQVLNLRHCPKLSQFPDNISLLSHLHELRLDGSNMERLPVSINHLSQLEILSLDDSKRLQSLPEFDVLDSHNKCDGLKSLQVLYLRNCCKLSQLPESINVLSSLRELSLTRSSVESLPASISDLPCLRYLNISNCSRLQFLFYFPQKIELVIASNCSSLKRVTTSSLYAQGSSFDFRNCRALDELSFIDITGLAHDILLGNRQTCQFCLPGKRIPRFFSHQMSGAAVAIKFPLRPRLLGFAFCVILSSEFWFSEGKYISSVGCECYVEECGIIRGNGTWYTNENLALDHVYRWYDAPTSKAILKAINHWKANDMQRKYTPRLFFKFFVKFGKFWSMTDGAIKECGVWAITEEEQMLELAKVCRAMDDQRLLDTSTRELNRYQNNRLHILQSDDSSDDDSVNQLDYNTKRTLEADEQQQRPLIKKKLKQSIHEPLPRGSKLEPDTEGIEGEDSNSQHSTFQKSSEGLTATEGWWLTLG